MTTPSRPAREIDRKGRVVGELFSGRKYSIDNDQRAHSLHEQGYDHNPGFRWSIEENGLPLTVGAQFKKADRGARLDLYHRFAERISNPDRLAQEAAS